MLVPVAPSVHQLNHSMWVAIVKRNDCLVSAYERKSIQVHLKELLQVLTTSNALALIASYKFFK